MAALFILAKAWKLPKCPLADDWMKKTWSGGRRGPCVSIQ